MASVRNVQPGGGSAVVCCDHAVRLSLWSKPPGAGQVGWLDGNNSSDCRDCYRTHRVARPASSEIQMISVLLSSSAADCELATSLEKSGARIWAWPALAIDEPDDDSSLSEAINNLFGYDWLILKNAHAADYFLRRFLRDHQPEG